MSGAEQKRGTGPKRLKAFVLCALAILAVALVAPRGAKADYSVLECAPGEQAGFADVGLYAAGGYSIAAANDCGRTGMRLDAKGVSAHNSWVAWQVNAAAGTRFKSAQVTVHYGTDGGYGPMSTSDGSPGFGGLSGGAGANQWATPVQTNTNYFAIIEQCFANPCNSNWAYAWSTRFYAVVEDFYAPGVSASGDLLGGGVVSGVQPLQVTASDAGGGARSISISVNGTSSQGMDFCAPTVLGSSYHRVKPCPDSSGAKLFNLDTENDPGWVNGPNDLVICSADVAGNVSHCLRRTVHVDNSCPASGAEQATRFESGIDIGGRLRSQASVRSTDAPVIRGRLATSSGNPVGGATVCVYETVDLEDASRQLLTTATTQANGRFATRLDPGASRRLDLVYRYNTRTLGDSVKLDSTVVPTLKLGEKTVANGERVHFGGGLPGPNAAGRAVACRLGPGGSGGPSSN